MKQAQKAGCPIDQVKAELVRVAEAGQQFVDGDLCREALQPYARAFRAGDDMDYNPAACVPLKKALLRLQRLSRVPCSVALWRQRPDLPDCAEALLFGSISSPEAETKPPRNYTPKKMFPQVKAALCQGRSAWKLDRQEHGVMIRRGIAQPVPDLSDNAILSLFVPIEDSMGEIAAALQVFTAVLAE